MGRQTNSKAEPEQPDTMEDDVLTEVEQLKRDLASARARVGVLEEAVGLPEADDDPNSEFVNDKRLTHSHDIERFWRLGKLSPRAVLRFQEAGQLPKPAAGE